MALRIYTDVIELARGMREVIATIAKHDPDLGRQTRRALTSIALNVAECRHQRGGHGRMRFQTAMGSADEVRACLEISGALDYIEEQRPRHPIERIHQRRLLRLMR